LWHSPQVIRLPIWGAPAEPFLTAARAAFLRRAIAAEPSRSSESSESSAYASLAVALAAAADRFLVASFSSVFFFL